MKKNIYLSLWMLCLPALFLNPAWLPWIGEFLVVADPLQEADALALLAGDENERLAAGALLFRQGYAGWFILTDMRLELPDSAGVYSTTVKRKAVAQGVPEERILITPGQVSTTYEEAARLKEFALSRGFRSLIVVTSPFHTRRARGLLREAFRGSGVTVIVRPALSHPYRAGAWWRAPQDRRDTALEFAKLLGHRLGCRGYGDCGSLPWALLVILQRTGSGD